MSDVIEGKEFYPRTPVGFLTAESDWTLASVKPKRELLLRLITKPGSMSLCGGRWVVQFVRSAVVPSKLKRSGPTDLVTCDIQKKRKGLRPGGCVLVAGSDGPRCVLRLLNREADIGQEESYIVDSVATVASEQVHVSLKLDISRNVGELLALPGPTQQPQAKAGESEDAQAGWREAQKPTRKTGTPHFYWLAWTLERLIAWRGRKIRIDCAHTLLVSQYEMLVFPDM